MVATALPVVVVMVTATVVIPPALLGSAKSESKRLFEKKSCEPSSVHPAGVVMAAFAAAELTHTHMRSKLPAVEATESDAVMVAGADVVVATVFCCTKAVIVYWLPI